MLQLINRGGNPDGSTPTAAKPASAGGKEENELEWGMSSMFNNTVVA